MIPCQLTLREWGPAVEASLSPEEIAFVRLRADKILIEPVPGTSTTWLLSSPSSYVGALAYGDDLTVHIAPKVGVPRLMFLLTYAMDPKHWREETVPVVDDATVLEAVVPSFVRHVRHALSRGLLQGYRVEEDALATVRGRILFDEQLRARHGIMPPIEVRYDEFTEDIEENRLLRGALRVLTSLRLRSPQSMTALRRADHALQSVTPVLYDPRRVPAVVFTRLNERYRPAVELARMLLEGSSPELRHGRRTGTSFFIDMSVVFEEFVRTALREALGLSVTEFPAGAAGPKLWLDRERKIKLEPDLSWWSGDRCRFTGDVKYKRTQGSNAAQNPDAYQLLAYLVATGLDSGMLIYAKGEEAEPLVHHVDAAGRAMTVVALDLMASPDQLLAEVAAISRSIAAQATAAAA